MLGIAILGRRLDLVFEEMREVGNLRLRQIGLVIRELLQSRTNLIAQAVAQHQRGTDEVGSLLRAFRRRAVAVDAELRVDLLASIRRGRIHFLAHIGTGLSKRCDKTNPAAKTTPF